MALNGKLEIEIEIKAPADLFYNIFRSQSHHIPNICSDKIHGIEVHQGDWETLGSVKQWNYTLEGKTFSLKETIEEVDEINKTVKFKVLDGEIKNHYKSFTVTGQAIPKVTGSLVKWTVEYEKLNEDIPSPDAYLDFAGKVTKDIDEHLLKENPSII